MDNNKPLTGSDVGAVPGAQLVGGPPNPQTETPLPPAGLPPLPPSNEPFGAPPLPGLPPVEAPSSTSKETPNPTEVKNFEAKASTDSSGGKKKTNIKTLVGIVLALVVAGAAAAGGTLFLSNRTADLAQNQDVSSRASGNWVWKGHQCGTPYCECGGSPGGQCVKVQDASGCGWSCLEGSSGGGGGGGSANNQTSSSSGGGAKCDGWADDQSIHCNTQECLEYKCNNGSWGSTGNSCGGGSCSTGGGAVCGDGACNTGETVQNCPADCDVPGVTDSGGGGGIGGTDPEGNLSGSGGTCDTSAGDYCIRTCHFSLSADDPECNNLWQAVDCGASANTCEQIDCFDSSGAYKSVMSIDNSCGGGGGGGGGGNPPPTPTPTPRIETNIPMCVGVKTYLAVNNQWVEKTSQELNAEAKVGDVIRLAVRGAGGTFTKAQFVINAAAPQETTEFVNGEYVYDYVIPEGGSFSVAAQLFGQ